MNLSKKSIKRILRILDNKCIEVPTKTSVYSSGGRRILTRDFEPKESHGMNDCSESSIYRPKDISTEFIMENRKKIGIFQISGLLLSLLICEVSYG